MQWHGLRVSVILLAFLGGLVVFLGARWLYDKFSLEGPLTRVLEENPAVQSFEIQKDKVTSITVQLGPTGNLKETYQKLYTEIKSVLDKQPFEIKLKDNRDSELERAFYCSQFAIYEAIVRGNYREMINYIEERSGKGGVKVKVFLDQKNIYIQMERDRHYLYEIIPRNVNEASLSNSW